MTHHPPDADEQGARECAACEKVDRGHLSIFGRIGLIAVAIVVLWAASVVVWFGLSTISKCPTWNWIIIWCLIGLVMICVFCDKAVDREREYWCKEHLRQSLTELDEGQQDNPR